MVRPLVMISALAGCADTIAPDHPDAAPTGDADPSGDAGPTGPVATTRNPDGTSTTVVDATSMTAWMHVDLEAGTMTDADGPWELRFQRYHISANAGVEVAPIAGTPFAQVTAAPSAGWLRDEDVDHDGATDYAFEQGDGWYDYDATTHVVSPRPLVWALRTADQTIKLELTRYYDTAGTSGWITFRWGSL